MDILKEIILLVVQGEIKGIKNSVERVYRVNNNRIFWTFI